MPTQPCRYRLSLQEDSVFLDLDVYKNDCLYVVRISYDEYGCCHADGEKKPKPLSRALSKRLIELIEAGNLEQTEAVFVNVVAASIITPLPPKRCLESFASLDLNVLRVLDPSCVWDDYSSARDSALWRVRTRLCVAAE